jgi:hypothetical protein
LAEVTYYTVADEAFFVGAVGLLNSLRITGNEGALVVLDCGLGSEQRQLLAPHARVVPVPAEIASQPALAKPFVSRLEPKGVVVLLDSDVIVTRSLHEIVADARNGRICAYPSSAGERDRWFPEWHDVLGLTAPLRRQIYMSAGLIAFSADRWPHLLERWSETCDRLPRDQFLTRAKGRHPFWLGEMDALNALLMSEIPSDAVLALPAEEAVLTGDLHRVQILDSGSLSCRHRDRSPTCLHYSGRRKPWNVGSWRWTHANAYARLLPRVLFGADVALRLPRTAVPRWLGPDRTSRLLRSTLFAAQSPRALLRRATRSIVHRLPRPLRERILILGGRMAHGRQ